MCTRADLRIVAPRRNDFNVVYWRALFRDIDSRVKTSILRRTGPLLNAPRADEIKSVPRLPARLCCGGRDIYA